jgi:translation initiation factor IF-1
MVKNRTGGCKTKGQARKFVNSVKQTSNLRISNDEFEVYAQVTKMLGNGMCHVLCIDEETRLCHIRGKFRGRGKRDNFIGNNTWILVGLREWELNKDKESKKLQNCDLLEVYSGIDVERLKNTVDENWNLFNQEKINSKEEDTFDFIDEGTSEYIELVEKQLNMNKNSISTLTNYNDEEDIDIDDI